MTDNKNELNAEKIILTERQKIQKRREYMRKYYQRKKMERVKSGVIINPSRPAPKTGSYGFSIKRGEFILTFK